MARLDSPSGGSLVARGMVIARRVMIERSTSDRFRREGTLIAAAALGHALEIVDTTVEGCATWQCRTCRRAMKVHDCGLSLFIDPALYRERCAAGTGGEEEGTG